MHGAWRMDSSRHVMRFGVALLPRAVMGLVLCCLPALHAKPDFSSSEIFTAADTVIEGDIAHFTVILRNLGDEPAPAAHVRIQWPTMGYVVEVRGVESAQSDDDARVTTASVSLPAGSERRVDVMVLASRDAGGSALSLSVQLIHFHSMAETWIHKTINIDTRKRADGLILGGLRIAPAGVITLAWLVVTALSMALAAIFSTRGSRSLVSSVVGVFGIMLAIGFWLIFVAMAWRDYRVLTAWRESTATIVGRRVTVQSVSSTHRRSSGSGTESRQQDVAKPEFALRYTVDGREMFSSGYDTGSSLRRGGGKAQLEKEFGEWTVGSRVPCWYDPHDPADVVLKRGFGGAYLFALLPLIPFWLGVGFLRHGLRR